MAVLVCISAMLFGGSATVAEPSRGFGEVILSPFPRCAPIRALADSKHGKRIYTVTPHFWVDYSNTFEPTKKIPAPLKQGLTTTLPIDIGEDPAAAHGSQPVRAVLRLGLRAPDLSNPAHKIAIKINGTTIYHGMVREKLTAVTGRPARHSSAHPAPPSGYFQVKVKPTLLRRGPNTLTLRVQTPNPGQAYSLVEVQLGWIPGDGSDDSTTIAHPALAN